MQDSVLTPTQEGRIQVSQLLHSAQDPSIQQMLCEHNLPVPINPEQRFTIASTSPGSYDLCLLETEDKIETKTAVTNAFIFACWLCDTELVQWIVQDLQELIDTDALIDGLNALEWAIGEVKRIDFKQEAYAARLNRALNICRFLLGIFGSRINANNPSGCILAACTYDKFGTYGHYNGHADIVAQLVRTYGAGLIHAPGTYGIFELLVENYEKEALMYLEQHRDRVASDPQSAFGDVLMPLAMKGSANMFKSMLDMFGSQISVSSINYLFNELCCYYCSTKESLQDEDRAKVEAVLGAPSVDQDGLQGTWAIKLTDNTIQKCLIECRKVAVRPIIQSCMSQIKDQDISLALAACCPQDLDLFDAVFDYNQDQIQSDPQLLRHAVIECAHSEDVGALERILNKCGSLIYGTALEFWAAIGDLDAVTMILEAVPDISVIIEILPMVLLRACYEGDTELIELVINFAGDSIDEVAYKQAFSYACYGYCSETIKTLASDHRNYFDYRSDNEYDLELKYVPHTIVHLLNSIYGTTLEPNDHRVNVDSPRLQSNVQYDRVVVEYNLLQSTKNIMRRK